jgi:hypothetical protein
MDSTCSWVISEQPPGAFSFQQYIQMIPAKLSPVNYSFSRYAERLLLN